MYRVDQASEIVNIPIFKRFYYMYPPRPRHHSSYKNTYRKSLNKRVPPLTGLWKGAEPAMDLWCWSC